MEGVIFASLECVVCMDHQTSIIFMPCRHRCVCAECDALIKKSAMECPMCRGVIEAHVTTVAGSTYEDFDSSMVESFEERRSEYVERMRATHKKNAAFLGKSRLARSVGKEIGNELEQRRKENAGTERVMSKKVEFNKSDDGETLLITYKVGRRTVKEEAPFIQSWDDVSAAFKELLDGDVLDDLDLPTYYPEIYWLWKYHNKPSLEGMVGSNKRTKR